MKTVIVVIICLAACAFAVYEVLGLVKAIKNRKKKNASECSSKKGTTENKKGG